MSTQASRFPARKLRPDGTYGCRGCGGDIPRGRRTWCSQACKERHDPFWVRVAVAVRDKGLCCRCGQVVRLPWQAARKVYPTRESYVAYRAVMFRLQRGEFHHVVPHCEGGAGTADNIQLLCHECHKAVTAQWRKRKAQHASKTS